MPNLKSKPEKWFYYHDDTAATPFPGWKIKVADDIQTPIALLPTQTARGKEVQGRRARLIVKLANRHFRERFQQQQDRLMRRLRKLSDDNRNRLVTRKCLASPMALRAWLLDRGMAFAGGHKELAELRAKLGGVRPTDRQLVEAVRNLKLAK